MITGEVLEENDTRELKPACSRIGFSPERRLLTHCGLCKTRSNCRAERRPAPASKQGSDLGQPDLLMCFSVFDTGENFHDIV